MPGMCFLCGPYLPVHRERRTYRASTLAQAMVQVRQWPHPVRVDLHGIRTRGVLVCRVSPYTTGYSGMLHHGPWLCSAVCHMRVWARCSAPRNIHVRPIGKSEHEMRA